MSRVLTKLRFTFSCVNSLIGKNRLIYTKSVNCQQKNSAEQEPKMDKFKSNPYFAKYEAKLKAVYNEDPRVFLEKLQSQTPEIIRDAPGFDAQHSKMAYSLTKKKTLDSIMKIDLVKDLPIEEIKKIWTIYQQEKFRLADSLQADEFKLMLKRVKEFNTFILPLPRSEGYEFILCQWSGNECHFTPLINFQAHGPNAPSTLSLIFFDELIESKKIVLEMAEVDMKSMKLEEAKFLVHQLKSYFIHAKEDDERFKILNCFHKTPDQFKHMDLVKQLENDKITIEQFKEVKAETEVKSEEKK